MDTCGMRWWRAAVPCTSPFLRGDRARSVQWMRWAPSLAAGSSPYTHQDISAQEWAAGLEHPVSPGLRAAPEHWAAPESLEAAGATRITQAAMGGSLPKHPIRGSCKFRAEFYFTSGLLQVLTHPSTAQVWPPEPWGVWGQAMGSAGDTHSLPWLCSHPGLYPSQETRAQSFWWWLL